MIFPIVYIVLALSLQVGSEIPVQYEQEMPFIDIDPQVFENQFIKDCKRFRNDCNFQNYPIVLVTKLKEFYTKPAGYCNLFQDRIFLRYDYYEGISKLEKEMLIYHELGHCALKRLFHTDGVVALKSGEKIPISLMGVNNGPTTSQYYLNREYYLEELFTN